MASLSLVLSLALAAGLLVTVNGSCDITDTAAIEGCALPAESQSDACSAVKVYISCFNDKVKDCSDAIKTALNSAFDEKKLTAQYCGAAVSLASSLGLSLVLSGMAYFLKTVT